MANKQRKGLLFRNEINSEYLENDEQHTASTISLLSQQLQQQEQHEQANVYNNNNNNNKHLSLAKQYAATRTSKNHQFPGKVKPMKHHQGLINNVKPYEQLKMQQSNPNNVIPVVTNSNVANSRTKQQKQQHRQKNNSTKCNNSNNNNLSSVRRIRKPSLWLGHFEKAKAKQQQQQLQQQQLRQDLLLRNKSKDFNSNRMNFNRDNVAITNDDGDDAYEGDLQRHRVCNTGGLMEKIKSFIIEFLLNSNIHGFVYLAKVGLNIIERTLWLAFICVAVFSIISLSRRTWQRFQTSPMVISMDRNKLVWNTSFPSLTVCPHKRIDELKVEEYILSHEQFFPTEEDKEDFKIFIDKLASLTYENIEHLPINKTYGITSDKYLDLLYELKWQFEPEISSGAAVKMYIYETQTELGICHSVNSLVARYNSYEYWKNHEWDLLEHGDRVTVHPLDGEIYAQIINLSTAYDVYFHSSGDVPSITKQRYTFPETDYTTVELIALEISTDEAARAFSTKQRKCRFMYESESMLTVPVYSFGLCLAECRMFFALKICHCVPHFYRNRLRNGRILPICGLSGLGCIAKLKREMISLKSNRYKIDCNCLANCDDSNFFVQSYRSRVWFLGANLQWGIIDYPKMQLRRDILFSFADVLVYIGGLVGFFLGCSALSFTEIIYYFTIRFARRLMA